MTNRVTVLKNPVLLACNVCDVYHTVVLPLLNYKEVKEHLLQIPIFH